MALDWVSSSLPKFISLPSLRMLFKPACGTEIADLELLSGLVRAPNPENQLENGAM